MFKKRRKSIKHYQLDQNIYANILLHFYDFVEKQDV